MYIILLNTKMKKLFALNIGLLLIINLAYAQTPQSFKYQTVLRDYNGNILANKIIALQFSIIRGSATGLSLYKETHSISTSDFGVANVNIGEGTVVVGQFKTIDWSQGPFFLKVEIDINNGSNFLFMGTSQLLSVPFALYAAKSGNAENDFDKDSTNELQSISINGNQLALNKGGSQISLDKYLDNTDSQRISLQGNMLSISGGNSIQLSGAVDLDSDPTNELQFLNYKNDTIYLTKGNYIILPLNKDNDSLNEIQQLLQNNNTVQLSKGGNSISVPKTENVQSSSLVYASASGMNDLQLTLNSPLSAYLPGLIVNFKCPATNTGKVTVNVNNLGVKQVFKNLSDTLDVGDIISNQMVSIIYDGNSFQFLASPFSKKSDNLTKNSANGLIPSGALIATDSPTPPTGFEYTGKYFSDNAKEQKIINNDSANNGMIYLATYNGNYFYYTLHQGPSGVSLFTISKFDTLSRKFTGHSAQFLNGGYVPQNIYLFNGEVYFLCVAGNGSVGTGLHSVYFKIIKCDLNTAVWSTIYNSSGINFPQGINFYPGDFFYFNNNLFLKISFPIQNVFLSNDINSNDLYKINVTSGIITRHETLSTGWIVSRNGLVYKFLNDSLFQMNSSFNWVYLNIIPKQGYSGTDQPVFLGNLIYYRDYIYHIHNNTFTPRNTHFKINNAFKVGNKYIFTNYGNYTNVIISDSLATTETPLGAKVFYDHSIWEIIECNLEKFYCLGEAVSEYYFPKVYYYHKRN